MSVSHDENTEGKSCPCPLCKERAKLLKGNQRRRYFCAMCCIEFTTDGKNKINKIFRITETGDLVEVE